MSFICEYCKKQFKRENTLVVHMCRTKRRHMEKDEPNARLGFRTYQLFYKLGTASKNAKSYDDFAGSQYYMAFVKFGKYCHDLKIKDAEGYATWLIKNGTRLDSWTSDLVFNKWIKTRLKDETPERAVERTILFMTTWAEETDNSWVDYFEKAPTNVIVFHICSGKISPWVIYSSSKAQAIIDKMNDEQLKIISDYIDPQFWQVRLARKAADFNWTKQIVAQAGL